MDQQQLLNGRYLLKAPISSGCQGDVYLAEDKKLERLVAVKQMKPTSPCTERDVKAFRREARITARFDHRNVVKIFDYDVTEQGIPYLVMEYLQGKTLDQLGRPLRPAEIRVFVKQVAAALQLAHDRGLVHRDLKPANIMFVGQDSADPHFVLLDLGIAKLVEYSGTSKTLAAMTMIGHGTPMYMAPEQARGQSGDSRSDVYALGSVLFELLSGKAPFGEHANSLTELVLALTTKPPPRLSDVAPNCYSPQLEELVDQCLQKEPADRPSCVSEVADRFLSAYNPESPTNRRTSARTDRNENVGLARNGSRGWTWLALAGCIAIAAALFFDDLRTLVGLHSGSSRGEEVAERRGSEPTKTPTQYVESPVTSDGMDDTTMDSSQEKDEPNEPDGEKQVVAKLVIPHLQFATLEHRHEVDEGKPLELDVSATCDVEDLQIQYQLGETAPEGAQFDAQRGRFTWTPGEGDGPGTYEFDIFVEAFDAASKIRAAESMSLSIEVREVNEPPQFAPSKEIAVNEGELIRQAVRASDSDIPATAVTYALSAEAPKGANIDATTGVLTWTPAEGQGPGEYRVAVIATDGHDPPAQSEAFVHVNVFEVNQRPKLSLSKRHETTAGELVTFHAFASDDDWPLQRLTFKLRPIITNANLDATTGRFQWRPGLRHIGQRTFNVLVHDDAQQPLNDTDNFTVVVRPPNKVTTRSGVKLVRIPGGVFRMGRREGDATLKRDFYLNEVKTFQNERPLHTVKIRRDFYVGQTEVTVAQFRKFVAATGYVTDAESGKGSSVFADGSGTNKRQDKHITWKNPGYRQAADHPVVNVSWNDAMAFCKWLSKEEGIRFRLPTEAEWEYYCRAGTNTRFWFGNDPKDLVKYANVRDASFRRAHPSWDGTLPGNDGFVNTAPVGSFKSNPFGLYDVHGNVWEWCQDWDERKYRSDRSEIDPQGPATGKYRIARGGCFY